MRLVSVLVGDERKSVNCLFHGWVIKRVELRDSKNEFNDYYIAVIEDNKGIVHKVDSSLVTFVNHYDEVLKK